MSVREMVDVLFCVGLGAVVIWCATTLLRGRVRDQPLTRTERRLNLGALLNGSGLLLYAVLEPGVPALLVGGVILPLMVAGLVLVSIDLHALERSLRDHRRR
jgi:hypothetical protein